MVFASGHMTALDLAQRVAVEKLGNALPPEPTDMRRRIAELERAFGSSLGLIGMLDIGKVDRLRDLANGYNSLRDYSRAEDAWRRKSSTPRNAPWARKMRRSATRWRASALNVANQ